MNYEYSKQVCLQTIYNIAKNRGIKISKVEEVAGFSPGYLSKLKKSENTTPLTVDVIAKLAGLLDVTVDMIITGAGTLLSPKERTVYEFLDRLEYESICQKLRWGRDDPAELTASPNIYYIGHGLENCLHPLMLWDDKMLKGRYRSMFYEYNPGRQEDIMTGGIYHANLNDDYFVYVSRIMHRVYNTSPMNNNVGTMDTVQTEAIEVYVVGPDNYVLNSQNMYFPVKWKVCCSSMVHRDICQKEWNLYQLLDTNYSSIDLSDELGGIISGYLQQGNGIG